MNRNRFFRTVWRVNGVLILLAFVLAAGGTLVGVIVSLSFGGRRADPPAAMAVEGETRLELGSLEPVHGTPFVLLPLETRDTSSSYGKGRASETRNLLFYDTTTGGTRWLRPDHRGVVVARELLSDEARPGVEDDGPVRFIRYELADADTDGDGEVTDEDAAHVAVSGPGGEGLTAVLRGYDQILGYRTVGGATLLVFFRRGDQHLVAEVDLGARKVRRTVTLPAG